MVGFRPMDFKLISDYTPRGDQGQAIDALTHGLRAAEKHQVLLGVTGSGKTYTMARLIEQMNRPALVLAHNKTDRKSTRLNSSHIQKSRMPSSA